MDEIMLKIILWLGGLLTFALMGGLVVRIIVKNIKEAPLAPLVFPLGILEILSYALSYIMGFPAFIGIWLVLKTAGRWKPQETPSRITNSFLIGNLLSVFIGVYLGAIFRSYLVEMGLMEVFKRYFLPG
jgi:prolipoprotein diacylglyceryltransferase